MKHLSFHNGNKSRKTNHRKQSSTEDFSKHQKNVMKKFQLQRQQDRDDWVNRHNLDD